MLRACAYECVAVVVNLDDVVWLVCSCKTYIFSCSAHSQRAHAQPSSARAQAHVRLLSQHAANLGAGSSSRRAIAYLLVGADAYKDHGKQAMVGDSLNMIGCVMHASYRSVNIYARARMRVDTLTGRDLMHVQRAL